MFDIFGIVLGTLCSLNLILLFIGSNQYILTVRVILIAMIIVGLVIGFKISKKKYPLFLIVLFILDFVIASNRLSAF